jgi:hypothetical protein
MYSEDLNPCDFFFWECINDHYYSGDSKTISDLAVAIKKTSATLISVRKNFCKFSEGIEFYTNSVHVYH